MALIISHSPEETFDLGRRLAAELRPGAVLALAGNLGAGKTQFVRGLAAGLGIATEATSPTFTLIHEYPGPVPLYHIDLYRLESEDEVLAIGIDDYLEASGITAIEWADKFPELMPRGVRWVRFRALEWDDREISL